MRLTTIKVPEGCKDIAVDVENGKLIVSFGSSINSNEFYCEETGHMEELPGVGDFAILWSNLERSLGIVANIVCRRPKGNWEASDACLYDNAIKFRNYEQYLKITGRYVEVEP